MAALIKFDKIGKKVSGKNLLADLSFGLEKNHTLSILGKNDSGKSTLLKILLGIIKKDSGKIYVDGLDLDKRKSDILSMIGYMSQQNSFDQSMTVFENLLFSGQLHGLNANICKKQINIWADKLDFLNILSSSPLNISYGNQRKIMLTRALLHEPSILLLDEPSLNSDAISEKKIWEIIDFLKKDKTIIYVTQEISKAEKYSDFISILNNGNLKLFGRLDDFLQSTKKISKYHFSFNRRIPQDFLKGLKNMQSIKNSRTINRHFEFYCDNKNEYFKLLKIALNYDLSNIALHEHSLKDVFISISENEDQE